MLAFKFLPSRNLRERGSEPGLYWARESQHFSENLSSHQRKSTMRQKKKSEVDPLLK